MWNLAILLLGRRVDEAQIVWHAAYTFDKEEATWLLNL